MDNIKPMTAKTYWKKPLEVQAWTFPETMTAQFDLSREIQSLGGELKLYDYAVEKSDTRFQDGANWRWSQAHVMVGTRSDIARIGDVIILDPVTGWATMDIDTFTQTYEEQK